MRTKVPLSLSLVLLGASMSACSSSGGTSSSVGAGPTSTLAPATTPLGEAPLSIPINFRDACRLEPSVCSNNGEFGPYGPFPSAFDRPLALPSVAPGQTCPVTQGQQIDTPGFGGGAIGSGPARPIVGGGGDPVRGVQLDQQPRDGWYGIKTLWFTDPSYQGPVRIRGARIDAPGVIAFGEGPYLAELVIPPGPTINQAAGYREAPGGTYIRTPGCYAWQVDGVGFSNVFVFHAVPAQPTAYPPDFYPDNATPYEGLFFINAPPGLTTECQRAAARLHFAVPCPTRVLYGAQPCADCVVGQTFRYEVPFPGPADYVGPVGVRGVGLFTIEAATTSLMSDCLDAKVEATVHAGNGIDQQLLQCTGASAATWTLGGVSYLVRVDGTDVRNGGLAKLLAGTITLVGP